MFNLGVGFFAFHGASLSGPKERTVTIVIEGYSADRLESTVSVLANAFSTNPLHVAAFGPQRIDQNQLFFRIGLENMFAGQAFVALLDSAVCGYVHFNPSPYCLPAPEELPAAAAALFLPLGDATKRIVEWFSRWCELDPRDPHVHLGPIGVSPEVQGKGVGSALMARYIEHLKQEGAAGYLETDRPENLAFYKKFGFVVEHEERILGLPTWYMWRPSPSSDRDAP